MDSPKKHITITDRETCVTVLNRLEGVFLVNDLENALEPCPTWDDTNNKEPSAAFKTSIKAWSNANKKVRGYYLQHLCEQDYDYASDFDAHKIKQYLQTKYLSMKENFGLNDAVHQIRNTTITDHDDLEQAIAKMNNILTSCSQLTRIKFDGIRVSTLNDAVIVSFVLDALPPCMGMLRQSWMERDPMDIDFTVARLKASVITYYNTRRTNPRSKSSSQQNGRTIQTKPNTTSSCEDAEKYGRYCKPCQRRHKDNYQECKDPLQQQKRRLDALDRTVALMAKADNQDTETENPRPPFFCGVTTEKLIACLASAPSYTHTLDSGANKCFYKDPEFLYKLTKFSGPIDIDVAMPAGNKVKCQAVASGELHLPLSNGSTLVLTDAYYVPMLKYNLLSESALDQAGFGIIRKNQKATIVASDSTPLETFPLSKTSHLYERQLRPLPSSDAGRHNSPRTPMVGKPSYVASPSETLKWHLRLGCMPLKEMRALSKKSLSLPMFTSTDDLPFCESCAYGKQTRTPAQSKLNSAQEVSTLILSSRPLELVHTDIAGPFSESLGKSKYYITFIDDATRFCVIFLLTNKSQACAAITKYIAASERLHNRRLQTLRFDNSGENTSIAKYAESCGIRVTPTAAYHPSLNGVAERVNRSLANKYLPMLVTSKLPDRFWAEALRVANYLRNCSPCSSFTDRVAPYEKWFGRAPDMCRQKIFGCVAYTHVPKNNRNGKLDTTSVKCVNLGYYEEHRQYRLFEPITRRIILSRDVKFDERSFITLPPDVSIDNREYRMIAPESTLGPLAKCDPYQLGKTSLAVQGNRDGLRAFLLLTDVPDIVEPSHQDALDAIGDGRSAIRLMDEKLLESAIQSMDPRTIKDAMASENAAEWQGAIDLEISRMLDMGVWDTQVPVMSEKSVPGLSSKPSTVRMARYYQGKLDWLRRATHSDLA